MAAAAAAAGEDEHLLSLFASALSDRRFGEQELRLLDAALSAGPDVSALLHTRSSARQLLRDSAAQAFSLLPDLATTLSIADFFARAFALAGDVESCLAMRYEALLLREAKYTNDLHLQVSNEEWLTFAKDCLDNGFYTIASKAFANALVHIDPSRPRYLDSTNSILNKDKINGISGLQNMAKSLSALRSEFIQYVNAYEQALEELDELRDRYADLESRYRRLAQENTTLLLCRVFTIARYIESGRVGRIRRKRPLAVDPFSPPPSP